MKRIYAYLAFAAFLFVSLTFTSCMSNRDKSRYRRDRSKYDMLDMHVDCPDFSAKSYNKRKKRR